MVHNDGPKAADRPAVAEQESAAGQWFLIGDPSVGSNPSVRSTILHASGISNRVLLEAQRHQQTQAAKQATDTNVLNSATDPSRNLTPVLRTPVEPPRERQLCAQKQPYLHLSPTSSAPSRRHCSSAIKSTAAQP